MPTFSLEDVRAVRKERDAWWTVLLVDPAAIRLTRLLANRTSITPDQLTAAAFALGLGAAGCFAQATPGWLALGALLYHLGFVLDCTDGKLARLKGTGTPFGGWLDFMLDRVRDGLCTLALAGGQYATTGRVAYLYLGFAILALDMIRYVNGPQLTKARRTMRADLDAAMAHSGAGHGAAGDAAVGDGSVGEQVPRVRDGDDPAAAAPQGGGSARLSRYGRVRRFLLSHRIRTHLVSGIEFQMFVFIVGPLTGAMIPVTAVTGSLLLLFEFAIVYRFCLSCRAYTRTLARITRSGVATTDYGPRPVPQSLNSVGAGRR